MKGQMEQVYLYFPNILPRTIIWTIHGDACYISAIYSVAGIAKVVNTRGQLYSWITNSSYVLLEWEFMVLTDCESSLT